MQDIGQDSREFRVDCVSLTQDSLIQHTYCSFRVEHIAVFFKKLLAAIGGRTFCSRRKIKNYAANRRSTPHAHLIALQYNDSTADVVLNMESQTME